MKSKSLLSLFPPNNNNFTTTTNIKIDKGNDDKEIYAKGAVLPSNVPAVIHDKTSENKYNENET